MLIPFRNLRRMEIEYGKTVIFMNFIANKPITDN